MSIKPLHLTPWLIFENLSFICDKTNVQSQNGGAGELYVTHAKRLSQSSCARASFLSIDKGASVVYIAIYTTGGHYGNRKAIQERP